MKKYLLTIEFEGELTSDDWKTIMDEAMELGERATTEGKVAVTMEDLP